MCGAAVVGEICSCRQYAHTHISTATACYGFGFIDRATVAVQALEVVMEQADAALEPSRNTAAGTSHLLKLLN